MRIPLALAVALAAGCSSKDSPTAPATPAVLGAVPAATPSPTPKPAPAAISIAGKGAPRAQTPPDVPELGPAGPSQVRSTAPEIYVRNLAAQRQALDQRVIRFPDDAGARASLAAWHSDQMQLDGNLDHAVEADRLLTEAIAKRPDEPKYHRQRAGVRAHMHRFREAKAELEGVLAKHPDDQAAQRALGWVTRNLGDWKGAEPLIESSTRGTTFDDYGKRALLAFLAGDIDAADEALRRAHGAYNNVHPVPLAWIDLQRGHLRLRTGRWEEARTFFRRAYARLPQNFEVAEHLAEVESLLGKHTESLRIYDEVVAATGLPEFIGAKAGVLRALGRTADADAALLEADRAWRALLAKYPEAMAAHAIHFWLEDKKDPAEALKWAEMNLGVRQDPDSLLLAARARAANGDLDGARALLIRVEAYPLRVDEVFEGIAEVKRALGDAAGAEAALAAARALNPKAGVTHP
mgnify:CR=1 FL=1